MIGSLSWLMAMARVLRVIALAAAIAAFIVGVRWGTLAAGGSDSSCYLNEARLFSGGTTHIEQPLVNVAGWPNAAWTFTAAGPYPLAGTIGFHRADVSARPSVVDGRCAR